ncbi:BREX-1 system adenine-specific DNA-methyltransferase PglX [Terribacillus sp. FSL K6-0262]|uniref:BREX-1 system adenine-specific DNA-methyltransferase PglX n=1 Tax=Terribacillus sp. FSL K6-0262 TaxID=2921447 RepID=UPI0030ED8D4C
MNKTALKTFATNARRELLKKVEARAMKIGITEDNIKKADIESSDAIFIDGRQLSKEEKIQRDRLIDRIGQIGFKRVMEEVAYTWFNRFTALRYMEVNDYLPTKVRVLSSTNADSIEPDMLKEALSLDLDLDKEYIYDLKMNNSSEELFKYLIIKHCNDLNRYMPFMFETIDDYTEILFPEGLLATDSFVRHMTNTEVIPEDNWKEIEVIGWLYQYYIAEEKDQVFANLKKNIKITKDTLPAATQLFTPNWIVRYMVENSLGRIWIESYPGSHLRTEWRHYLDDAEQEDNVIKQLEEIRYKNVNPEEITFLDPCCGSGHILVYAFDVFYDMYLEKGYVESEIPQLIIEKNLFGLDVDNRAAQLASFAVMMKARGKSRRIFRKSIQPNVYAIQESNWLTDEMILNVARDNYQIRDNLFSIRDAFIDAKEYGSILEIDLFEYDLLEHRFNEYVNEQVDLVEMIDKQKVEMNLPSLLKQSLILSHKFDVVCTNPPYMGSKGMNTKLTKYLKSNYPNTKSDLSTVLMEKSLSLCKNTGYISMINIPVWMFIQSYEKLRENLISNNTFINMIHLGRGVFGSDFGTTTFVISKAHIDNYQGVYRRLFIKQGAVDSIEQKEKWFFENLGHHTAKQKDFCKIPGNPIAYWVTNKFTDIFLENDGISEEFIPKFGMSSGDGKRYIRDWYEVNINKIKFDASSSQDFIESNKKWGVLDKGGTFRRWYGNKNQIVLWEDDGKEIKENPKSAVRSPQYFFQPHISWTLVTSYKFSARYFEKGFILDTASNCLYFKEDDESGLYVLGLLNTKVVQEILNVINPTINYSCGVIGLIPYKVDPSHKQQVEKLVAENIKIAERDWNSYESSWGFKQHPLITYKETGSIEESFKQWNYLTDEIFTKLKYNEEEINRIFINVYGLNDEVTPEVEEKDISVQKADLERDIKSFISYVIGCTFGRYSLDKEGLIYAGGEFDTSQYKTFSADKDNILPILSGAYFDDDIVTRFVEFVRISFGEKTLNENLDFVANALGRKKGETAKETLRRYFLEDFYQEHVKSYNKQPIYWLFTSGKEKAFNCLIYMHRYDKTTLSRIRTDYLHDYQIRLDAEKNDLLNIIEGDSTQKEISNANKELKSLEKKIDELKAYDELLHHMADMQIEIDLDDGVKVNYEKFKGLVAKI